MKPAKPFAISAILSVFLLIAQGQPTPNAGPVVIKKPEEIKFKYPTFQFARVKYSSALRKSSWATDYPDADLNLTAEFQKVTGLKCKAETAVVELSDPNLKDYPFIYIAEGGNMSLNADEVKSLRSYLLAGGFLMVDDFWGQQEWDNLASEVRKVFPDRIIIDLPLHHEIFRSFYRMTERPQVPNIAVGIQSQSSGVTWERVDAKEVHFRGIVGNDNRLMALFCHNTDLGDGWERATENEYYDREFSQKKAFPMGINIVVYALTH